MSIYVWVMVDILLPENNGNRLIEVKTSTGLEDFIRRTPPYRYGWRDVAA
jgi:hypothetical protein